MANQFQYTLLFVFLFSFLVQSFFHAEVPRTMYSSFLLLPIILLFANVGALRIPRDTATYSTSNSSIAVPSNAISSGGTSNNTTGFGASFWLEQIKHQGSAAFNTDSSYQVFRNVKDFGAKGNGVSDDTAALNLAISSGNRCKPGSCEESTTSPALVYIPGGTYLVSAPIIDFYFTQIIGNPNNLPILKATNNFTGLALIDGNPYQPGSATHSAGYLAHDATNIFYRQIRNLVLDSTDIPATVNIKAIHWPTAQATSLENLIIRMSDQAGTQHQGIFIESGSGGFMSDIEFYGGRTGVFHGANVSSTVADRTSRGIDGESTIHFSESLVLQRSRGYWANLWLGLDIQVNLRYQL